MLTTKFTPSPHLVFNIASSTTVHVTECVVSKPLPGTGGNCAIENFGVRESNTFLIRSMLSNERLVSARQAVRLWTAYFSCLLRHTTVSQRHATSTHYTYFRFIRRVVLDTLTRWSQTTFAFSIATIITFPSFP